MGGGLFTRPRAENVALRVDANVLQAQSLKLSLELGGADRLAKRRGRNLIQHDLELDRFRLVALGRIERSADGRIPQHHGGFGHREELDGCGRVQKPGQSKAAQSRGERK